MPAAGEFFLGFGVRFIQKTRAPQGGSARAAGGNFLGIWGALYTKTTLLGRIQERVSGAKHPQILKIFASGGPNPQMFENNPPCCKIGNNKGGLFSSIWGFGRRRRKILRIVGVFCARNTFLNASQQRDFCVQRPQMPKKIPPAAGADPPGGLVCFV